MVETPASRRLAQQAFALSLGIPVLAVVGSLLLWVLHPGRAHWQVPFVIVCIIWAGGIVATAAGVVQGHRTWTRIRAKRKRDRRAQQFAMAAIIVGYAMLLLAIAEGFGISLVFGAFGILSGTP